MTSLGVVVTLAAFAAGMVGVTGVLIKWAALTTTQLRAVVVLFLLIMMTGMLLGAAVYFVSPGSSALVAGFWVASVTMSAAVLLVFVEFFREARVPAESGRPFAPVQLHRRQTYAAGVIAVVIANEFAMGWTFARAAGGPVWLGGGGWGPLLANVFVSPWFVFPMALEMVLTLAFLAPAFPRGVRGLLATQPLVMVASPPTLSAGSWVLVSAVLASGGMALAIGWFLRMLYRGERIGSADLSYALRLFSTYGLMAAGLGWWALDGSVFLFAVSVLLQMVVFLHALLLPGSFASRPQVEEALRDATVAPEPAAEP